MKIYISTDMEGISGIVNFEQTGRDSRNAEYEKSRMLLTEEVNAAVTACKEAGAEKIVVMDGHCSGFNFLVDRLHPDAEYVIGGTRKELFPGLAEEKFDGMILLGYHAKSGTENAFLDHTMSSRSWYGYWVNGVEMGETGQAAIMGGLLGIPVILVTGDIATCEEASRLLPGIETVAVKKAFSRTCGQIIPPQKAREMIKDGIKKALGRIREFKPFSIKFPATIKIAFQSTETADQYEAKGWKRLDGTTVEKTVAKITNGFDAI